MAQELGKINSTEPKQQFPLKNRDLCLLTATKSCVESSVLDGKLTGLLMGPHWLIVPLHHAISVISESYDELKRDGKEISFVYVAADRDEEVIETLKRYGQEDRIDERPDVECFERALGILPKDWFAVPLEPSEVRLEVLNNYRSGIFSLAFVGIDGNLHTIDGLKMLEKWGAEAYPFTEERIEQLRREAVEKVVNQSFQSLLTTRDRDFLITADGKEVKVAELEGKIVELYFAAHWNDQCQTFTPMLADIYKRLKEQGAELEIVFISSHEDRVCFENYHGTMPWLAVPYSDLKTKKMLNQRFEAFPFTPERLAELEYEEQTRHASQTLEKLFVTGERDYVIGHGEKQVGISSLRGKTVGLYFSAQWCLPCQKFTPRLISVYNNLKESLKGDEGFEIIFISGDRDEVAFRSYYESMPWLALPYGDEKIKELSRYFDIRGIPSLVVVGSDGKTVTSEGRNLINLHWERAYPFTVARLAEIQKEIDEEAKSFPKIFHHTGHPHVLHLVSADSGGGPYICCVCDEQGSGWAYQCAQCGYELHPKCAQEVDQNENQQHQITNIDRDIQAK